MNLQDATGLSVNVISLKVESKICNRFRWVWDSRYVIISGAFDDHFIDFGVDEYLRKIGKTREGTRGRWSIGAAISVEERRLRSD